MAFVVRIGEGEPLPEGFPGSKDRWHVHDVEEFVAGAFKDRPVMRWLANEWLDDKYRDKGDYRGRLAMAHVWTIPNPDGVFADHNRTIAYLKLGLPAEYAEGATMEAALGLMLATPDGCDQFIDPDAWMANLPGRSVRQLKAACGQMGDYVRAALGGSKAEINAAAEAAWRGFDKYQQEALTAEQKARIAAGSGNAGHSAQHMHDHAAHN